MTELGRGSPESAGENSLEVRGSKQEGPRDTGSHVEGTGGRAAP